MVKILREEECLLARYVSRNGLAIRGLKNKNKTAFRLPKDPLHESEMLAVFSCFLDFQSAKVYQEQSKFQIFTYKLVNWIYGK